ncbi:hypothetical protein [Sulfurospirillum deleyianum]|uniref:Uncharacterized protein n=1 Tax=Sulfurospirillum deleyianum (strain ATCC 51133 / DSM 6946 / 5175) TaxID=525898 RepID=D1B418_SULD5|nr:hypothetical protein [Sulfurospirillum deleyianum]ACZ12838.1 hypothetical protein Sdel_1823 [Sulfurospirillum deleyianum DSM 6946]
MKPKGLALYQAEQKRLAQSEEERLLEMIEANAKRHGVDYWQNATLLQGMMQTCEGLIEAKDVQRIRETLLWLIKTQESVELS